MVRIRSSFLVLSFGLLMTVAESLQALPAFARQTGLECMVCHTQNQTKLGGFGRQFALSGYTMSSESGSQSLIEGEEIGLGIPMILNMSLMLKARVRKGEDVINGKGVVLETSDGDSLDANRGMYEMFKTSTLNVAGRVSENIGTIIEFREKESKAIFGGKVTAAYEIDDGYAGVTIFSTNNYGPFTGMEAYNTGLYKPLRQFENHKLTNATQASDLASGKATGVQAYYGGNNIFLTVGAYVPMHNSDGIDIGGDMIPFARLAYEQPIGDVTLIVGAYAIDGTSKASNTSYYPSLSGKIPQQLVGVKKEAYGFDLQLEGTLMDMSILLTGSAVLKHKTTLSDASLMVSIPDDIYGEPEDGDMEAYSVDFAIHPWPTFGIKMAYLTVDDKGDHFYEPDKVDVKDKDAYTLGFDYSFRQNVMLTMEYSMVNAKKEGIKNYKDLLSVLTISF